MFTSFAGDEPFLHAVVDVVERLRAFRVHAVDDLARDNGVLDSDGRPLSQDVGATLMNFSAAGS
jgi:hypothetical protein